MGMVISLRQFALTGKFGPVEIGMTKSAVISHLGEAESECNYDKHAFSLSYGAYELFFNKPDEKLTGLQNDHLFYVDQTKNDSVLFSNSKFEIDSWFIKPYQYSKYAEVRAILQIEGIAFIEESQWGATNIKLNSGIYLSFTNGAYWSIDDEEFIEPAKTRDEFFLEGIRLYQL